MTGYSIDEDQFVAAARVLQKDVVFFRSVETASSGPLNIYPLLLPVLFGIEPGLFSSRCVGVVMICGSLICVFCSVHLMAGGAVARGTTLGLSAFYSFVTFWDFMHYASELTPMFLFSLGMLAAFAIAMRQDMSTGVSVTLTMVSALALSLMPLAKLQASYLGIFGGVFLIIVILTRSRWSIPYRLVLALVGCVTALVAPLLFAAWMLRHGAFDYFVKAYFGNAIAYVEAGWQSSPLELFSRTVGNSSEFGVFAAGWVFAMAVLVSVAISPGRKPDRFILADALFVMTLLAVTVYTIVAPRRDWPHYLLFAPAPMILCLGVAARRALLRWSCTIPNLGQNLKYAQSFIVLLILLCVVTPMFVIRSSRPNPWVGHAQVWDPLLKSAFSPVGKAIKSASKGTNELLTVWGYNPNFHVETGLDQATRLSISTPQFNSNSLRDFFRSTYLEDIRKNKPGVFADAAVKGQFPAMDDSGRFKHEMIAELGEFIADNYELVNVVQGVRIYRWRSSPVANFQDVVR
jgi:hypothetical protein